MTRPLRVALLTAEAPDAGGGVGDYTKRLAEALVAAGSEVGVVSPVSPATADRVGEHPASAWTRTGRSSLAGEPGGLRPDAVLLQYVPYLYSRWGLPIGLLAAVRRLARETPALILVAHEPFNYRPRAVRHRAVAAAQRVILRALAARCAAVVVTTETRRRTVKDVVRAGTRIRVIPVGATLPGLDARGASGPAPDGDPFRVTVFGRLELGRRRPDVVYDSAAALAGQGAAVEVQLFGSLDAATVAWCSGVGVRPGLRLSVCGRLDPADAAAAMTTAHVTVAFDTAGLGGVSTRSTVAANAFAGAVPLVANAGDDTDSCFVDGENVLLCEPRATELAPRLASLRASASLRDRLARAGRRLYDERLSWRVIAAQYEALAREIAEERP